MKEEIIVDHIEKWLKYKKRWFINLHGSLYSKAGSPDFLTHDKNNIALGIEAKAPGRAPFTNQWRRGIEMIQAGNRYIVAYDDFDLDLIDQDKIPVIEIDPVIGESEFELKKIKLKGTTEIVLK